MKIQHFETVSREPVTMEGASGCSVRWLLDENDGAPNFSMRQFDVAAGGHTPMHHHPYEHEVFVLEGEGELLGGDAPRRLRAGDVVFVAPDEVHQFRNTSDVTLRFLCLVPNSGARGRGAPQPECERPEATEQ